MEQMMKQLFAQKATPLPPKPSPAINKIKEKQ